MRERDGIRILGGVVACVAIPIAVVGIMAKQRAGGHDAAYLAWVGGLMFFAGVAAFRGSRAAAVVISGMSALVAVTLVVMLVRTSSAGTAAIVANVTIAVLLLLPTVVTAVGWRRGSSLGRR
jgi:hypothetical protein